jgi:hypothetical protein
MASSFLQTATTGTSIGTVHAGSGTQIGNRPIM